MNPSIELRLKSMISAMQEVVIPAIPPSGGLAREQASLVLGHLHMLLQQFDLAPRFERLELAATVRLGEQLLAAAAAMRTMQTATGRLTEALAAVMPEVRETPEQVRLHTESVSAAIEQLIDASIDDGGAEFMAASQRLVLDHGRATSLWNRSWVAMSGFEPADSALPSIPEMIKRFGNAEG